VMGCGQFCTNPGLIIGIKSPEYSQFIEKLTDIIDAKPAQTMLNAGTLKGYSSGLKDLMAYEGFQHLAGQTQQGDQAQPQLFKADVALLLAGNQLLQEEIFGPATIVIEVKDKAQLIQALSSMNGQLTAALIADEADFSEFADVVPVLEEKAGRLLLNGYPTGVEVCEAMVHGGPYPATSDARGTSVGTLAIDRYLRPICYQNYPQSLLPEALKDENPFDILRLINGKMTRNEI
jgi:alpha-ketoglutaric semialdehyde dehydrogenase